MTEPLRTLAEFLRLFPEASLAGILAALVLPAFGVFLVLRRASFLGVTLAQVSVLGVGCAMILGIQPALGAAGLAAAAGVGLGLPRAEGRLPKDAILGGIFVASTAAAILVVAGNALCLHCVQSAFYGDLVLCGSADLAVMAGLLVPAGIFLVLFRRPVLHALFDAETARVLGMRPALWETAFFAVLAVAIASSTRTAGTLLIFCHLVAGPMAALLVCRSIPGAVALACGIGLASTLFGMGVAYGADLPLNPTIAASACGLALLTALLGRLRLPGWRSAQVIAIAIVFVLFISVPCPCCRRPITPPSTPATAPAEEVATPAPVHGESTPIPTDFGTLARTSLDLPDGPFLQSFPDGIASLRPVVPDEVARLDGRRIRLAGYLFVLDRRSSGKWDGLLLMQPISCCAPDSLKNPARWMLVEGNVTGDPAAPTSRVQIEGTLEIGLALHPELGVFSLYRLGSATIFHL